MSEQSDLILDGADLGHIKVLVTGASGYIGRNLLNRLIELNCQVSVITRNKERFNSVHDGLGLIEYDLGDINQPILDVSGFDVIFNCAGELKDPSKMQGLHVDGTMRLLKSLRGSKTRWVQLSSVGVYGQNVTGVVEEDYPFNPIGSYEVTKAEADIEVKKYCIQRSIPFSILRPSNVFSPDMTNKSLEKWIGLINSRCFFQSNKKDKVISNYVYIGNVVDALILCGFHARTVNEDFIISDSMDQYDFVTVICNALGVSPRKQRYSYALALYVSRIVSFICGNSAIERKIRALNTSVEYSTIKLYRHTGYVNRVKLDDGIYDYVHQLEI